MNYNEKLPSLDKLQAKIDVVKGVKLSTKITSREDMSQAMRLIVDLAAGVIMGVGVGYFVDIWLKTIPLFMITGLFIGMAAGVKNMLRSAELIDKKMSETKK
jgi:ATP synthase protein I